MAREISEAAFTRLPTRVQAYISKLERRLHEFEAMQSIDLADDIQVFGMSGLEGPSTTFKQEYGRLVRFFILPEWKHAGKIDVSIRQDSQAEPYLEVNGIQPLVLRTDATNAWRIYLERPRGR